MCSNLIKVTHSDGTLAYRCEHMKPDNLQYAVVICKTFNALHAGKNAVPNGECPFAMTGDYGNCPLYNK